MANTQPNQRHPSHIPALASATSARFIVGRDRRGSWIVLDRHGLVGGLFASEAAALHFAAEECNHNPADICRAPEGAVLDLGSLMMAAQNLH